MYFDLIDLLSLFGVYAGIVYHLLLYLLVFSTYQHIYIKSETYWKLESNKFEQQVSEKHVK